jgi:transcriptional regulator with XRE-family HTH domain
MATTDKTRSVFGEKLRGELARQDMSIRELARRLDPDNPQHTRRALHKWIAADPPAPSKASRARVAGALGLDPAHFEEEDDEEDHQLARDLLALLRRVVSDAKTLQMEVL